MMRKRVTFEIEFDHEPDDIFELALGYGSYIELKVHFEDDGEDAMFDSLRIVKIKDVK